MATPLPPALIIVMGASGCGKSSVGLAVAKAIHAPFVDGDDLHPASNVAKMSTGTPLTDEDRLPWLLSIRSGALLLTSPTAYSLLSSPPLSTFAPTSTPPPNPQIVGALNVVHTESFPLPPTDDPEFGEGKRRKCVVVGCSALKGAYRDLLRGTGKDEDQLETFFIYLHGTRPLLLARMEARQSHFFKAPMLDSQLATLEPPSPSTEKNIGVVQLGEGEGQKEERGMDKVVEDAVETAKKWLA